MSEKIQSPFGRVSWPFVFGEGDPQATGEAKYTMTLMVPKNKEAYATLGLNPQQRDTLLRKANEFIMSFKQKCELAAQAKFGTSWKDVRWNPIIDGADKAEKMEINKHFWLLRMKTKFKPKVQAPKAEDGFIADGNEDETDGFYAGCWARCNMNIYCYNQPSNKGVAIGLGAIQKAYTDDPFTQGAANQFDGDVEDIQEDDPTLYSNGEDIEDLE